MKNPKFILFICASLLLLIIPDFTFARRQNADLIIRGGTVVTMDGARRVIENGAIVVQNGAIIAVGNSAEINSKFTAKQTINAEGKAIIPGLINTHTHIPMGLFRGIADDLDLQEWLTKYIFPAEAKNVDETFVRAGTRLGLAEMIRGGTTTYCDMYYFEDAIADETQKAGMRGVLGETVIDFPAPDNKNNAEAMTYVEKFIKKWQGNPLIVPAIAPHAPYTVSEEHLRSVRALSDKLGAPIVMHLAEAQSETDFVMKNKGMRSIEYINKIGFFNDKVIAAHVIQANDEEIQILKKYNVGVAHCPQSNMKLAAGVARIPQMLSADLAVGIGTDGAASNNDLDMWDEMDTVAKLHKVFSGDPKVTSAKEVFEMATIRGARALHLESKIGSLETGKRADLVIVDLDSLHQTPLYNIYSNLVYATKAEDVRTVIVEGKVLLRDKVLQTLNEQAIKATANTYQQKIFRSLTTQ